MRLMRRAIGYAADNCVAGVTSSLSSMIPELDALSDTACATGRCTWNQNGVTNIQRGSSGNAAHQPISSAAAGA
jgi:hypothetical protein